MTAEVDKILNGIVRDIIEQVHIIMASDAGVNQKVGINTLGGSNLDLSVNGKVTGDNIDIEFNDYIVYIEWNRPPEYGKMPPYNVILKWLKKRGIQPTAKNVHTVEQLAWAIRYMIWKEGWKRRIIAGFGRWGSPLDDATDKLWEEKWANELFDALTSELDKYFND